MRIHKSALVNLLAIIAIIGGLSALIVLLTSIVPARADEPQPLTRWIVALQPPRTLEPQKSWTSSCIVSTRNSYDVHVALELPGTLKVQRHHDANCQLPTDLTTPVTISLVKHRDCLEAAYCGNIGQASGGVPFMSLRVTITNTADLKNAIIRASFLQE